MKGTMLVILRSEVADLDAVLRSTLEPHRLDEDDLESIRAFHWDYWMFAEGQIGDRRVASAYPGTERELLKNACCLRDLAPGYTASAAITPDGVWIDLIEHGWRFIRDPSPENEAAVEAWTARFRELKERFAGHIGVEIVYHC